MISGPGEMQQAAVGLPRYLAVAPYALAGAGVLCALLWFGRTWQISAPGSYASCVVYFGFFKVLGPDFVPWLLTALAVGAYFIVSKPFRARWTLFLLHAMGTMTGLYMAFHLPDFLAGWEPFKEIVHSLWLLARG
jgi:hypothetical protein